MYYLKLLTCMGVSSGSMSSNPNTSPIAPPRLLQRMAFHSMRIPITKIVLAAELMPTDCNMRETSLVTDGEMPKPSVMIGNTMDAPPSDVIPGRRSEKKTQLIDCILKIYDEFCRLIFYLKYPTLAN